MNIKNRLEKHIGKIVLLIVSIHIIIAFIKFGLIGGGITLGVWILVYFALIFWRVFPAKGKLEFYNKNGRFKMFDIVYDRGSATRPNEAGILKYQVEAGWFIVYSDGFEWVLSDFSNIELYKIKNG